MFYYQQVQKQVTFPRDDTVSENCKQMIRRLLAPLKVRIKIHDIVNEPWSQLPSPGQLPPGPSGKNDTGQESKPVNRQKYYETSALRNNTAFVAEIVFWSVTKIFFLNVLDIKNVQKTNRTTYPRQQRVFQSSVYVSGSGRGETSTRG